MRTFSLVLLLLAGNAADAQSSCANKLLVSGYFSNNVAVYDACTGAFERQLDSANNIVGAQATRVSADGKLYVVSEGNGRILRYSATTLAFETAVVALPPSFGGTGLVLAPNQEAWVAGYNYDGVRRFSLLNGQYLGDAIEPRAAGLNGADNGMVIGPDGMLYVPGYDSHSVVRRDPATGSTTVFVSARSGGLFNARGILFEAAGTVLVSSEGNGQVLRYGSDGTFRQIFLSGLSRPTGMAYHPDGSLLVTEEQGVVRFNAQTGARVGILASAEAGGVSGPTFVTVLPVTTPAPTFSIQPGLTGLWFDPAQNGHGFVIEVLANAQLLATWFTFDAQGNPAWFGGVGSYSGDRVTITATRSTGGRFPPNFNPAQVSSAPWGTFALQFLGCNSATIDYVATVPGFGSGRMNLTRLTTIPGLNCQP